MLAVYALTVTNGFVDREILDCRVPRHGMDKEDPV